MSASTREFASTVLDIARTKGVMIATAESCTGGLIAAALTDIAGSSDVIDRGFIKGYISEEYNKLVLSRKDPFPKILPRMFA